MLFFVLLVLLTLTARALPSPHGWPARMRLAMAAALMLIGTDHWLTPERYLAMIPPWIPFHVELVLLTGAAEVTGAIGLLVPRLRAGAGTALALYFVAVFPANIHNALSGHPVPGLPDDAWYYWMRLAFQPLAVWWALYCSERIEWPFTGSQRVAT